MPCTAVFHAAPHMWLSAYMAAGIQKIRDAMLIIPNRLMPSMCCKRPAVQLGSTHRETRRDQQIAQQKVSINVLCDTKKKQHTKKGAGAAEHPAGPAEYPAEDQRRDADHTVKARSFDAPFYDIDGFSTQLAVTDPFPTETSPYTTTHKIESKDSFCCSFFTELSDKREPSWFFDADEGRPCQLSEHRSFDADLNGVCIDSYYSFTCIPGCYN